MRPGFGVAHGDQPVRHGYSGIWLVGPFFHIWQSQQKGFVQLKGVKDSVCKWYPSLEVEVPAALLLHVTDYSIFSNSSIILPGLRASIGVTRSYSSCPFLCSLDNGYSTGDQGFMAVVKTNLVLGLRPQTQSVYCHKSQALAITI